jgi:AcrR family transcriptional regulator
VRRLTEAGEPDIPAVEKRIVDAAITCIEREGLHHVTIRGIAHEAGVNSAAISYYFRSKEKLVERALKTTLANAFGDWEELLADTSGDLRKVLRSVLGELFEGSRRYPGLVKAHLYDTFVEGASHTPFLRRFNDFLIALAGKMKSSAPRSTDREIGIALAQVTSAVLLPGMIPGLFRATIGVDLGDARSRAAYVDRLIDRYFPPRTSHG